MLTYYSFILLGIIEILLSFVVITRKWPVTAALFLVLFMMNLAGMFGILGAHFNAVSQIIVYAGAIMVLFVFVIMLLNIPVNEIKYGKITPTEIIIAGFAFIFVLVLGTKIGQGLIFSYFHNLGTYEHIAKPYYSFQQHENLKNVAFLMFSTYLWAFELISFLLVAAILGAVVIAKKEKVSHHASNS